MINNSFWIISTHSCSTSITISISSIIWCIVIIITRNKIINMIRMNYIIVRIIFMSKWFSSFFVLFSFQGLKKSPFVIEIRIRILNFLCLSKLTFSKLRTITWSVNILINFLYNKLTYHTCLVHIKSSRKCIQFILRLLIFIIKVAL